MTLTNGGGTQTGNGPTFNFSVSPAMTTTYMVDPTSHDASNCPISNSGSATVTVTSCFSDLAVTKSDSPDPVFAGNNLTYTINFSNNGPDPASTVAVTDATPANTTFVSASVTTGTDGEPQLRQLAERAISYSRNHQSLMARRPYSRLL